MVSTVYHFYTHMKQTTTGCSVISRIGIGFLSDRFSPWLLGFSTLAVASLATFTLWGIFSTSISGLVSYGVVYGTVAGGWSSMWTGLIKRQTDDPGTSNTMFFTFLFFRGLGNVLSTPISSSLVKNGGDLVVRSGFGVDDGKY
jgi:MFS transporter, MCT family, solute carrier family 16 (monocarboxylic acid transporters), member 10